MATATIQFTQGLTVGNAGQSVIGFVANAFVTLTDAGGPASNTTWLWQIVSWPAPLSSVPPIISSTAQVATMTPTMDGVYIFRLTRVENSVTTVDIRFFAVLDVDGFCLPSPGQTGHMTNVGASQVAAQNAGWAGGASASTNVLLDGYLRGLKSLAKSVAGQFNATVVLDWYIATNGSDTNNTGRSPSSPFASFDGLIAATGLQRYPTFTQVNVHVGPGTYTPTATGIFDVMAEALESVVFNFQGTRTYVGGARTATPVGSTGTVSAVTSWDGTAKTEGLITVSSGIDFSQFNCDGGYFAEVVGGARDGLSVPIIWISTLTAISGSTLKFKTSGSSDVTLPQVGDVLRIYTVPALRGPCLLGSGNYFDLDFGANPFVVHSVTLGNVNPVEAGFTNCILRGLDAGAFGEKPLALFTSCVIYRSHFTGAITAGTTTFLGGVEIRYEGTLTLDDWSYFPNCGFVCGVDSSGVVIVEGITAFEAAPTSITLTVRSIMRCTAQLWFRDMGSLPTSPSILLSSGSLLTYSVLPAFVGTHASVDANIAGVGKNAADLPFINTAAFAGILSEGGAVPPTPTPSWNVGGNTGLTSPAVFGPTDAVDLNMSAQSNVWATVTTSGLSLSQPNLAISIACGNAVMSFTSGVEIDLTAPTITLAGAVNLTGPTTVTGAFSATTSGTDTINLTAAGNLNASGASISLIASDIFAGVAFFGSAFSGTTNLGAGSGGLNFNGAAVFSSVISVGNATVDGNFGQNTAANTVDRGNYFEVNQTTAGRTLTIPAPTGGNARKGQLAFVSNIGSASFTMLGKTVSPGSVLIAVWKGATWVQGI